ETSRASTLRACGASQQTCTCTWPRRALATPRGMPSHHNLFASGPARSLGDHRCRARCPLCDSTAWAEIAVGADHRISGNELCESILRPAFGSSGPLRHDDISPFRGGIPNSYLHVLVQLYPELLQNAPWIADSPGTILI